MTPAGTSNEHDVQNEWEENTHTHTYAGISHKHRRHGKLGLQLDLLHYTSSRIGWVSMKRIHKKHIVDRCRRDSGKLSNNYCYTYLTKDQHPPSNLVVYSAIQCSIIEIMI